VAGAAYSVPGAYYLAGLALLIKLDAGTTTDIVAVLAFNLVMLTGTPVTPGDARTEASVSEACLGFDLAGVHRGAQRLVVAFVLVLRLTGGGSLQRTR
jgi:hypothetical protein